MSAPSIPLDRRYWIGFSLMLSTGSDSDEVLLTPREVAKIMGVSTMTVGRWARTDYLAVAACTPGGQRRYRRADVLALREAHGAGPEQKEMEEDAVRLYNQGWTIRRVADKFDVSYGTMRRILIKHTLLRS